MTSINFATLAFASIPKTTNTTWDVAVATLINSGYRLPTNMQYMWATSDSITADIVGGVNTGGYKKGYAGSTEAAGAQVNINCYAWTSNNSGSISHPVGIKLQNELGLYDMSGNATEWCWDWSGSYPMGTVKVYLGAASGTCRVMRGCVFSGIASEATSVF